MQSMICNICSKAYLGDGNAPCPDCWNDARLAEGRGEVVAKKTCACKPPFELCAYHSGLTQSIPAKPTNPKDCAATTRLDLSLFPSTAVAYGALALTEGHQKYGGYNWRKAGVLWSVYDAACRRHLDKYKDGEWEDSTTLVPHLASALACIAILIDAHEQAMLNDDRPPAGDMTELLTNCEAVVGHLQKLYPNGPGRCKELSE